jgi:DNA-binding NarL/FixJ family response regulator
MDEVNGFIASTLSPSDHHLTPRQLEVLELLSEGLSNKVISRRLGISAATTKAHVSGILRALDVRSRLEAVLKASRLKIVVARVQPSFTEESTRWLSSDSTFVQVAGHG